MKTAQTIPAAIPGDELYFRHPKHGVMPGKVLAAGADGCVLRHAHGKRRVPWGDVHGYKSRAEHALSVVDRGEDGFLAEDKRGRRVFVRRAEDEPENKRTKGNSTMRKAIPLLFLKSHIKGYTRQDGTYVREHDDKRQKKAGEPQGSGRGYGMHNVEPGDALHFGEGGMSGRVHSVDERGATVHDERGGVHKVAWADVKGFKAGGGGGGGKKPPRGDRKPVPPEKFRAAEWAKGHDDAGVTVDSVLSSFPPDTADKIRDAQDRLARSEQTIDMYRWDGVYSDQRQKLHEDIFRRFINPERIAACKPEPGQKPTFTMLGGRGGSGKSWFKGQVYDPKKSIVLDADNIKELLPEYKGWNAGQVHEESSDILESLLEFARNQGLNVVLDGTMKTAKSAIKKVRDFKNAGFRVEAHYMHLPRQEAAKRAVARFLGETQRLVPPEVVLSNTTNEASFDEVRKLADAWSFRDNNVKPGEQPILISESGGESGGSGSVMAKSIQILWRLYDGKQSGFRANDAGASRAVRLLRF